MCDMPRKTTMWLVLTVDPARVPSDRPAGSVAGTNPPAGSRVARGTAIVLRVSAGPTPSPTPGG